MQHKEFIILCLEDCSDWSNATTRRVVMQVCFLSIPKHVIYLFPDFSPCRLLSKGKGCSFLHPTLIIKEIDVTSMLFLAIVQSTWES